MEKDKNIKVDCKEITPEGELICNISMKDVAEMTGRNIKPLHIKFNVKDTVLDSSQSTEENKSTDGTKPTEETKSSDGTKPTDGTKSSDETKPTKADSSNKQGCRCSTTESESANFLAKFQIKKEEN